MKQDQGEELREMYSPDEQGEYASEEGVACFSIQGLMDALTTIELMVTKVQLPHGEFAMQLEEMMADYLGCPHPLHSCGTLIL